jgi:hypothetical protein
MAEKSQFHLEPKLSLKWVKGNDYEATVSVQLNDGCFHEVGLKAGLPPNTVAIPETVPITYTFTRDIGKVCPENVHTVTATITVQSSDAKTKVTVYAAVNGEIAGTDTKPFPRKQ